MKTEQITFPKEIENSVRQLAYKCSSNFEFIASTKDGEVYDISFASSDNYQNFFQEFDRQV